MRILICTQGEDHHVASVARFLKEKDVEVVSFERYRSDHLLTYSYSGDTSKAILQVGDDCYDLTKDKFHSVWWRLKPIISSEVPGTHIENINEKFCMLE